MSEEQEYLLELLARMELKDSLKQVAEESARESEDSENLEEALEEPSLPQGSNGNSLLEPENPFSFSYSVHDEQVSGIPVAYAPLSYGEQPARPSVYQVQDEEAEAVAENAPAEEIMTVKEGEDVVQEAQYAVLTTGNTQDVDPEKLRQLDLRIKLEPSLLVLLTLGAATRDVNYAPWV